MNLRILTVVAAGVAALSLAEKARKEGERAKETPTPAVPDHTSVVGNDGGLMGPYDVIGECRKCRVNGAMCACNRYAAPIGVIGHVSHGKSELAAAIVIALGRSMTVTPNPAAQSEGTSQSQPCGEVASQYSVPTSEPSAAGD